MLQETVKRLDGLEHHDPVVICNEAHRFIVAEQLRQQNCSGSEVILEPAGRNTAPAIALAALQAQKSNQDPVLLVLAADHVITQPEAFRIAVKKALPLAEDGYLVTFGIVPDKPETGYGYIRQGSVIGEDSYQVSAFVEKPDSETARQYLASGDYSWNSGMFLFKASRYIEELKKHSPDILAACEKAIAKTQEDMDFIRIDPQAFLACPDDSIDYAVMEKTDRAAIVPMDAGWSDVGSWTSLWEVLEKDDSANATKGDVELLDVKGSYIDARSKLVAAVGVSDLVVVETEDAILVADKSRDQDIKKIVERLKKDDRIESRHHRVVYRPWGMVHLQTRGERYKVKKITINPGQRLSLQKHYHRAEHWVVVAGTAKVTCGDTTQLVTENQSTYIPVGMPHALENPGKLPLEMVEVQTGSYLCKDDIVRLEDLYGFDKDVAEK